MTGNAECYRLIVDIMKSDLGRLKDVFTNIMSDSRFKEHKVVIDFVLKNLERIMGTEERIVEAWESSADTAGQSLEAINTSAI